MRLDRREYLRLAAGSLATGSLISTSLARDAGKIKAVAFDAFPIFDPRPVSALAEKAFAGKGADLNHLWRTRQLEDQWLRALSGRYADFWQATEEALVFAARANKLDLTRERREELMGAYLKLKAWPDVLPALKSLKNAGIRLALLSNATPRILHAGVKNSGLEGLFEHVLSTDRIRSYKPDPWAYQMAVDAFGMSREEIGFAAFAGWDVAGAKWFGYPTFWVNRLGSPAEELGVAPDAVVRDLAGLASLLGVPR
jgi:2-haloacid dehalogenase